MVDAMPIPDSRQKVDELFLFWLSESSTQEMLRKELTKVCRYGSDLTDGGADSFLAAHPTMTNIQRPKSPNYRTPSPPLHLSNSPKSPRTKRRAKSPRRNLKSGLTGGGSSAQYSIIKNKDGAAVFEDVDYFPAASASPPPPNERDSKPSASEEVGQGRGGGGGGGRDDHKQISDINKNKVVAKKEKEEVVALETERRSSNAPAKSIQVASKQDKEVIPRFFFPNGQPKMKESVDEQLKAAAKLFQEQPNGEIAQDDFHSVVKVKSLSIFQLVFLHRCTISQCVCSVCPWVCFQYQFMLHSI